jgi:hypothetical protein
MVCQDEEWTVCIDGKPWENWFDFIWQLTVSDDGTHVGAAIQKDMVYGMAVNDKPWVNMYENITGMVMDQNGLTAAVVQTEPMAAADINAFKAGIFACAVDGEPQDRKFLNIWDIELANQGEDIMYVARVDRENYTVVHNHTPWQHMYQSAWQPTWIPLKKNILAPVRKEGKWQLYRDDKPFWSNHFFQLWKVKSNPDGSRITAVVSDKFGKWSICENDTLWDVEIDTMIPDTFCSADGATLVAPAKHSGRWMLLVNNSVWDFSADQLMDPVISTSGRVVSVPVKKNGQWFLAINGKIESEGYDCMADPVISPDESKVMLKAVKNDVFVRKLIHVVSQKV